MPGTVEIPGPEDSMDDDTAVSYEAATIGSDVLTSGGTKFGTLEHVLEVPELDVFDGIVVATKSGLRFVDADQVERITRGYIRCSIDSEDAAQLPEPGAPPVYRADALADSGASLHDRFGRLFGRPHWKREHD
jgi:hypothetical protein